MTSNKRSSLCYSTEQKHGGMANVKKGDQFLKQAIRYPVLWLETDAVDHPHFTQKFPEGPYKFKEIFRISGRVFIFE